MLKIEIETGNDAFAVDLTGECARLLRGIADKIERGDASGLYQSVYDDNGNPVGAFRLKACRCANPCGCGR